MSTVPIAQGLVECRVMQHTPGPWRVERQNPSPTTGEWMISGAKPGYLAEVRDCGSGDVAANAKLIAAAPDLLAAIEAMRVAGGRAEFQAAFDKAKKLATVHNALNSGAAEEKTDAEELSRLRMLYDELLMAVGNKYPGETRHETALRYIRTAEIPVSGQAKDCGPNA